jgi:hypothetical protein
MRLLLPAVLSLTILWAWPASAELSVSGEAGDVTVEAKAATFSEIIDGIINRTGMQISVEGTDDPSIDGDFRGSVQDVLTEMLRNTSFLISAAGDDADQPSLHVVIFGPAVEPVAPPLPEADNPELQPPPDSAGDQALPPPIPEPPIPPSQRNPPPQPGL